MPKEKLLQPDYLFEVSWEVCNKVGGIYTVITTKANAIKEKLGEHHFLLGPDLWEGQFHEDEFREDPELYPSWRTFAHQNGLKFRIGRWNISAQPIAILVDFSIFFQKKDEIFGELWRENKLDSITGGWDYTEPALFGYAAGKIIESFVNFHHAYSQNIVAHFHEWLTGAGVLYLHNQAPTIARLFTAHATVCGRAIAGSGLPLYNPPEKYDPEKVARNFNMVAKYSLEKKAAEFADCFTVVSEITDEECLQFLGKKADIITPNGFDGEFIPFAEDFAKKRNQARKKLLEVASAVIGFPIKENSLLVATSGRYEFHNKGFDVFIEALAQLNQDKSLQHNIIAFILVPATHGNPIPAVVNRLNNKENGQAIVETYSTHYLNDPQNDQIQLQLKKGKLSNTKEDKVKIIQVPVYLNGEDGIFNLTYYDVLIGFDLTVFPSYYEPFGYTPLESLAFKVPTATTTLAGFGRFIKAKTKQHKNGALVIERSDGNQPEVTQSIADFIQFYARQTETDKEAIRAQASRLSEYAKWSIQVEFYARAFDFALQKCENRISQLEVLPKIPVTPQFDLPEINEPDWKSIYVEFKIPENFKDLELLAKNLWWTWNPQAESLFQDIDPGLWEENQQNPVAMLQAFSIEQFSQLNENAALKERMDKIVKDFKQYIKVKEKPRDPFVAYFCMEYGLHHSLPLYSGGLGVLAGDYLKEASDQNLNMVGIGLLYRYGYFNQELSPSGEQVVSYEKAHFTQLPIYPVRNEEGDRLVIQLPIRGATIHAQIWRVDVGRIPLYLLDTDLPENDEQNRSISHYLYGGEKEYRLKQELLLGIGGIQLLETLKIAPKIFHLNEGHAAFAGLARISKLVLQKNCQLEEAFEIIQATTLFTTHTPVPAGHDTFSEELLRTYLSQYLQTIPIEWGKFMILGKANPKDPTELFSMTHLAARLSANINGVSKIHGQVTRKMLGKLWPGLLESELEVKSITNGVHLPSWMAPEWQKLINNSALLLDVEQLQTVPDKNIMELRNRLKSRLLSGLKEHLASNSNKFASLKSHRKFLEQLNELKDNSLIIGFARRFVSYKRTKLIFYDLKRLEAILGQPGKPVVLLFAGKAHPLDFAGQQLIRQIVEIGEQPSFQGKVVFLSDYNMKLASLMVHGVDLWLNTPSRKMEASGTSGMKASMNGVLNLSVLDGWWAEAYEEGVGWAVSQNQYYENEEFQNSLDADALYDLLETEIIPDFFNRNKKGISSKWNTYIRNTIGQLAQHFSTARMLGEYLTTFYEPMNQYRQKLTGNDFHLAKEIASWKQKLLKEWNSVKVVRVVVQDCTKPLPMEEQFTVKVILDFKTLSANDVAVELVFSKLDQNGNYHIKKIERLTPDRSNESRTSFSGKIPLPQSGTLKYGIRIIPNDKYFTNKRSFPLVKWI